MYDESVAECSVEDYAPVPASTYWYRAHQTLGEAHGGGQREPLSTISRRVVSTFWKNLVFLADQRESPACTSGSSVDHDENWRVKIANSFESMPPRRSDVKFPAFSLIFEG